MLNGTKTITPCERIATELWQNQVYELINSAVIWVFKRLY